MQSTNNWWQEIEQELERQFDRFLDDHPSQKELLEKEGVTVKDETIQNFSKHFWDPTKELGF